MLHLLQFHNNLILGRAGRLHIIWFLFLCLSIDLIEIGRDLEMLRRIFVLERLLLLGIVVFTRLVQLPGLIVLPPLLIAFYEDILP